MNSTEVLKFCPNYYRIVNFDFKDDDLISEKLIAIYKNYVFSIDLNNREELDKLIELDKVLGNYLQDYLFRSTLQKEILTVKIRKDNNLLSNLVNAIIKIFTDYEEFTTRKLYISKWI